MIPPILRIKKESHKNIAIAQDLIIRELYSIFNDAVLHGGTGIWRCYNGNRFSEDVDVYLKKDLEKLNIFFNNLEKRGFIIEKKKIGENGLFSNLKYNRIEVRFEALFKKVSGSLKDYETTDGNLYTVYTLTPEEFILEKIDTYLKRLKIRDLYDIFFLLRFVKSPEKIKNKLKHLIENYKNPLDEKDLKVLILDGIIPDSKSMLNYIRSFK